MANEFGSDQGQTNAGGLSSLFAQRVNGTVPDAQVEATYLADRMRDMQTQAQDNADAIRATAEFMTYNPDLVESIKDNVKTMHDQDAALLSAVREAAQNVGDPAIISRVENLMRLSNSGQFELTQNGSPQLIVAAQAMMDDSAFTRGRIVEMLRDPANLPLAQAFSALPEAHDVVQDMAANNSPARLQDDLTLSQRAAGILLDGRTGDFVIEGRGAIIDSTTPTETTPAVRRPMQNDF